MFQPSPSTASLFEAAGWKPQMSERVADGEWTSGADVGRAVISEFAGLLVGATGVGEEQAASNVYFYAASRPETSAIAEAWRLQVGNLEAIASAHNDHIVVFVSQDGTYYAFTDPDVQLYAIGQTFGGAMECLLLGLRFGPALSRDA